MAKHLIVRGVAVQVPFDVQQYADTGWEFIGRPRTVTKYVCTHHTGAENPPAALYHTLQTHSVLGKKVPMSIHFCVDQRDLVYQMADVETRCVHAGAANAYSVGIEFISRGNNLKAPSRGIRRDRVTETVHGAALTYDELLPEQVASGVQLIETLCMLYALPVRVPEDVNRNVVAKELSEEQFALHTGVIGHLHVPDPDHRHKVDPGLRILRAVQAHGRQLASSNA